MLPEYVLLILDLPFFSLSSLLFTSCPVYKLSGIVVFVSASAFCDSVVLCIVVGFRIGKMGNKEVQDQSDWIVPCFVCVERKKEIKVGMG